MACSTGSWHMLASLFIQTCLSIVSFFSLNFYIAQYLIILAIAALLWYLCMGSTDFLIVMGSQVGSGPAPLGWAYLAEWIQLPIGLARVLRGVSNGRTHVAFGLAILLHGAAVQGTISIIDTYNIVFCTSFYLLSFMSLSETWFSNLISRVYAIARQSTSPCSLLF